MEMQYRNFPVKAPSILNISGTRPSVLIREVMVVQS